MAGKASKNGSPKQNGKSQRILRAHSVSKGIAFGKVLKLHGFRQQFYHIYIAEKQIKREIERFHAAIHTAAKQLKNLKREKTIPNGSLRDSIIETHQIFLEDKSLISKVEDAIRTKKVNAEWAVKFVEEDYVTLYKAIKDEHLREKHIDLQDVTERIITALSGQRSNTFKPANNSIIAANQINPSTVLKLNKSPNCGIITESGGWTSHSFILARELRIPAVTGIESLERRINAEDEIIVDGFEGIVIINPDQKTISEYKDKLADFREEKKRVYSIEPGDTETLDKTIIRIRVNYDVETEVKNDKIYASQGIGLYRTEYLCNKSGELPNENSQYQIYKKVAQKACDRAVKIRLFDFTFEQFNESSTHAEINPALGLRATRFLFKHEKILRTQIRAILRASFKTKIQILLPMISDIYEIERIKQIIEEEKANLQKRKCDFGNPPLGVMIEVPSAVFVVDEIADEVDFLAVGTNDLVQYILSVDRDNELVADWFRTVHPAVLRSLSKIIEAAGKKRIPAVFCGEMAGSAVYSIILAGLGARELSMNITSLATVTNVLKNIKIRDAERIAKILLKSKSANESEKLMWKFFSENWSAILPAHISNQIKRRV